MISKKQRKFLETRYREYLAKDKPTKTERILIGVYLYRIRKKIERELDNLLWLCIHNPEIFMCEYSKNEYGNTIRTKKRNPEYGKQRLKTLLRCISLLTNFDVQLIKEAQKDVKA